uniref:CSON002101 protein n=1 Tax=Culicoides sonorensis TaxID=179676 RepID=A0A336MM64_CULSO
MSAKVEIDSKTLASKAVILDIEGTTTSISFVKDVLFPYVKENVESFLKENFSRDDVKAVVAKLREQAIEDVKSEVDGAVAIADETAQETEQIETVVKNVQWQMSLDRKTAALKTLEGLVYPKGYTDGKLKAQVYEDAFKAMEQWVASGHKLYIYSSGSVDAQKLLFAHTEHGDLTPHITNYFDTAVGAKQESKSYDVLFPYVKENVESFLKENFSRDDVKAVVAKLREQAIEDVKSEVDGAVAIADETAEETEQIETVVKNVQWQMSLDRKTAALKTLEGLVYPKGYTDGKLKAQVYEDAFKAMEQWVASGHKLYIYSSGSVDAQKLLFAHTEHGDLTPHITNYFDTAVGAKQESKSYVAIAKEIDFAPEEIVFLTDVVKGKSKLNRSPKGSYCVHTISIEVSVVNAKPLA